MANYRKSFNFRNGVQVDEDNLIVNSNGLVGIGTSVPTELLDVRGTTKVVGLITSTELYTGIGTVINLKSSGVNVSGIITASQIQIGSGPLVNNVVGYATDAWIITPSGISTSVNVSIGSTLVTAYKLDVTGNVSVSGGMTCLSGDITLDNGDIVLSSGDINVSLGNVDISTGSVSISSGNLNVPSGIVTALSFDGALNADDISSETLNNSRLPSNISVSGIVTASQGFVGNVTGAASSASSLIGTPNIVVGIITASSINVTNVSGIVTAGIITAYNNLYSELIGVGTFLPSSDIHVRRSGQGSIQVTSDSNSSIIGLGRSTSLTGYNGLLRYGNTSALFPYSNQYSLDILNYGPGNVNFYLEASNVSAGTTGSFYWHRRSNFARLMSLTYDGKLGIGVTTPKNTLEVVGTSTVTGNAYFGSDVEILNDLTINGTSFTFNGSYLSGPANFNAQNAQSTFQGVGVGTSSLNAAVDFSDAGKDFGSGNFAFMLVPKVSTAERAGLSTTGLEGAIIFNTSTKKFQGYTGELPPAGSGVGWVDLH